MRFEVYSHTADAGVRGVGASPSEAFEGAALATFSLMADLESVEPRLKFHVELSAESLELLLVKWLNELISLSSLNSVIFSRFDVSVEEASGGFHLSAEAWGDKISPNMELREEVKAATFADLKVEKEKEKEKEQWVAQCIVDV